MYKIVLAAILIFLSLNCKSSNDTVDPIYGQVYPAVSGLEWEYNTISNIDYYDTTGNISHSETIDLGNTIVRVTATNQSLNAYKDLIKFISYDVNYPDNYATDWYENTVNGFYLIAYKTAGSSQPVVPKLVNGNKYLSLNDIRNLRITPGADLYLNRIADDSVQYYNQPRKVLAYPVAIGNRWNELQSPFLRDRHIIGEEIINVNGTNYSVYKIESIWSMPKTEFNDYLNLTTGLVMREFIADSVAITSAENPDGIIGFVRINNTSELVRKNF